MDQFDINLLRSAFTVVSLVAFVVIVIWAWSRRRQAEFAEAAQLALNRDEDLSGEGAQKH